MKVFAFSPLDTWFFGDGRPFNQGEMNSDEVSSQFPPPVSTIVGGIRAALAMNQGWPSNGDWSSDIKRVLGDLDNLAGLRFVGPTILFNGSPVFKAPSHLLARPKGQGWDAVTKLQPGKILNCDLGASVRLPVAEKSEEGLKELSNVWLTLQGMQQVINGGLPDLKELISSADLWMHELKTGFEREYQTRVVKDGALYSCRHVRPNYNTSVAVAVDGLPANWEPASPTGFGGEGRSAWIETGTTPLPFPGSSVSVDSDGKVRFNVILNSPANFASWPRPGGALPGIPGQVVFACIGRSQRVGGWNSIERKPLPLKPLVPPGSVWFMEADGSLLESIKTLHGTHLGDRTNWGYGQIMIGNWKERN